MTRALSSSDVLIAVSPRQATDSSLVPKDELDLSELRSLYQIGIKSVPIKEMRDQPFLSARRYNTVGQKIYYTDFPL